MARTINNVDHFVSRQNRSRTNFNNVLWHRNLNLKTQELNL